MQDPERELPHVIGLLTSSENPATLRRTIERFFVSDASLHHPLSIVRSGPNSRSRLIGVYEWYRIVSPGTKSHANVVAYDKEKRVLFADVTQSFGIRFSPFRTAPSRLIVRIHLEEKDGRFYIKSQEDFFHPTDLGNYLLPPVTPLIRLTLIVFAFLENLGCNMYFRLGLVWMTLFGMGSDVQRGKTKARQGQADRQGNDSDYEEGVKRTRYGSE
ncbi:hypothetical protein HYDPIDRAFT_157846 [Hydnomerulius pinastri MD-312]|uniref:SigF-like NTF2-like domain-containing protein n=1 Tax=Hydnomerulius pinastri MD-312 TaxID=994086 RepID=A0A0C9V9U0_9AGAM|nr:hypothetical protein HYDPIDRAFT_157846 [Hydnomerulius pinastri MD-312]